MLSMAGEKWSTVVLVAVSKTEVESLIGLYHELLGESAAQGRGVTGLDRSRFRTLLYNMFGMTDDMIMDGGILFNTIQYYTIFVNVLVPD